MAFDASDLEVRHRDANHALFMVLTECCRVTVEIGRELGSEATPAAIATNILASGKDKMTNKEIADCAFRLAVGLKQWKEDSRAEQLLRMLPHLMLADRWEAQLRG